MELRGVTGQGSGESHRTGGTGESHRTGGTGESHRTGGTGESEDSRVLVRVRGQGCW